GTNSDRPGRGDPLRRRTGGDNSVDQRPKRNWWGRNWKWVVPAGCLAGVLLCGGVVALTVGLVFGAIKSSEPYTEALARAKADDRVKDLLGEPVEAGYWVTGEISISGPSGKADLAIPIS